jgi:hypothetical protein
MAQQREAKLLLEAQGPEAQPALNIAESEVRMAATEVRLLEKAALAVAADYKRRGMDEKSAKCWAAAEALNDLAKDLARKTGEGLRAHNDQAQRRADETL